ncbi:hypothetical protein D3C77_351460 [compost metagenome]
MTAVISPCGLYRYRLERECSHPFEGSKVFAYFGINPSTADATLDDATVRKWKGFTVRNGGHRFIVGNVFSYRATDVRELARVDAPWGPEHMQHLTEIITSADVLVPCWGASGKVPPSLHYAIKNTLNLLLTSGKPVLHFGLTASGDPKHPLMLGYDTQLIPWGAQP